MNATPIEFCFLLSHVLCRVYWQDGKYILQYYEEDNVNLPGPTWITVFKVAGYQSMAQFMAYVTGPLD